MSSLVWQEKVVAPKDFIVNLLDDLIVILFMLYTAHHRSVFFHWCQHQIDGLLCLDARAHLRQCLMCYCHPEIKLGISHLSFPVTLTSCSGHQIRIYLLNTVMYLHMSKMRPKGCVWRYCSSRSLIFTAAESKGSVRIPMKNNTKKKEAIIMTLSWLARVGGS